MKKAGPERTALFAGAPAYRFTIHNLPPSSLSLVAATESADQRVVQKESASVGEALPSCRPALMALGLEPHQQ